MLVSFIAELWHVVAYSAYMNTGRTNNFVYRAGQSTGKFIKGHLAYTSYADNLVSPILCEISKPMCHIQNSTE